MTSTERRWSNSSNRSESFKFPDFEPSPSSRDRLPIYEEEASGSGRAPSPNVFPKTNGAPHSEKWQPRRDSHLTWGNRNGHTSGARHGRQKSLTEAIRTVRARKGSVTANAHEIADALKAPVSIRLIVRVSSLPQRLSVSWPHFADSLL